MVIITKANGETEEFSFRKAKRSCERSGASKELAKEIVDIVSKHLYSGITTKEIQKLIYSELSRKEAPTAKLYRLREAISELNPDVHEFEKYITKLFSYFGYETKWSPKPKPQGLCVDHEIDVLFKKNNTLGFIECKHHFKYHRLTGLDVPMRVWARLQDLREGYKKGLKHTNNFVEAWIVSNTKFSEHAKKYASCKNIPLLGWSYPKDKNLAYYIETSKAYPLSILNIDEKTRYRLLDKNIVNTKEFFHAKKKILLSVGLVSNKIEQLNESIEELSTHE